MSEVKYLGNTSLLKLLTLIKNKFDSLTADDIGAIANTAGAVTSDHLSSKAVTSTKIADDAVSQKFTVTILATGWTGEAAPYTNVVTVTGLLATDTPLVDMIPSDTFETAETEIEAYASIYKMVAAENQLTAYATEKPTVDINIHLKAVRK